jgi:hypothetical protein
MGHDTQTYRLSGPEALTPGEMIAILYDVLARPLRFIEVEPTAARQTIPDHGQSEVMADAITALRVTALESFTSVVHPTVEDVTGIRPNSFRDWATRHIADFTQLRNRLQTLTVRCGRRAPSTRGLKHVRPVVQTLSVVPRLATRWSHQRRKRQMVYPALDLPSAPTVTTEANGQRRYQTQQVPVRCSVIRARIPPRRC